MSPLNRGPLPGPRMLPAGMRPPLPRFHGVRPPMPGMPPRMPPPPIGGPPAMFGPMRHRMMLPRPPPGMGPMRPGPGVPPLMFGPRGRGIVPPLMPPMMGPKGMRLCGPPMRPRPRLLPPQGLPHMRPRFPIGNGNAKGKPMNSAKKVNKLEALELRKPWMTDEIRNEIQKKNKLYAKAKKNKDAKEWDEFKDLRNKVTRMIRDAKNDYLAKNPEQGGQKTENKDKGTNESDGVQETENTANTEITVKTETTVKTESPENPGIAVKTESPENIEITVKTESPANTENGSENYHVIREPTEETQPSGEKAQS